MDVIIGFAQLLRIPLVRKFNHSTVNVIKSQRNVLLRIIKKNQNTLFGRRHNFSKITSIKDYKKYVPIQRYSDFKSYIEMISESGKKGVLTYEDVLMFGLTSGTTSQPKLIPITKSFTKIYKHNWDIWTYFAYKDHPVMFNGKILALVGKDIEGYTPSQIPFGSISGLIDKNQAEIVKHYFALPYYIYKIKDYEAKYYAILRLALEQDISCIITPNPSMILLLMKKINEFSRDLIADIAHGTVNDKYNIERNILEKLLGKLRPNPLRALELLELTEKYGELLPKHIWPDLALISCWKGGTLPIYLKQFPHFFGNIAVRDIGLISTEGQSSVPITDKDESGVLLVNSLFFEFIPVDKFHEKNIKHHPTLCAWELELGKEYYLIFTNHNGLYRYFTNDVVKVVSYYNNTPVIKFMHKGEHVTSLTGEKITEWQVVHAMRNSLRKMNLPVHNFTLFPKLGKNPHYVLLIELYEHGQDDNISRFIKLFKSRKKYDKDLVNAINKLVREFDNQLKELNVEYKSKRNSLRLKLPVVKLLKPNSYEALHKKKTLAGSHDAQIKIPSLSSDPNFDKQFSSDKIINI